MNEQPLLIAPEEAARRTGLSRSRVYQLLKTGDWPVIRVGRRTLIPAEALHRWIAAQTSGGGQ
jgi:excisionase family DNA binding protein